MWRKFQVKYLNKSGNICLCKESEWFRLTHSTKTEFFSEIRKEQLDSFISKVLLYPRTLFFKSVNSWNPSTLFPPWNKCRAYSREWPKISTSLQPLFQLRPIMMLPGPQISFRHIHSNRRIRRESPQGVIRKAEEPVRLEQEAVCAGERPRNS